MKTNKKKYYAWHSDEPGYMDFLRFFVNKKPVLDIGCGIGWLGKYHNNLYGVDNDRLAVKNANKYEKAILCDVDKELLPFKDSFFKGVIAKDIIEHLHDPIKFTKDINRVLKPNGIIFISTKLPGNHFWDDYTHVRPYNKISLTSLLEDNGFAVEKLWYSGNWWGLGFMMRVFNIKRTPAIFFILTRIFINRNNINILAVKLD